MFEQYGNSTYIPQSKLESLSLDFFNTNITVFMLSAYNLAVTLNFNKLIENHSAEDAALFLI